MVRESPAIPPSPFRDHSEKILQEAVILLRELIQRERWLAHEVRRTHGTQKEKATRARNAISTLLDTVLTANRNQWHPNVSDEKRERFIAQANAFLGNEGADVVQGPRLAPRIFRRAAD